ncbi:MAG: hypothetical protein HOL07_07035 [Rhodospirillaceae bacterium]|jgi:hypothetical protein|nr:hypothetical protein [Rhodospirillales bacterium]MBT3807864.1 hypothetical protein [Rhodospirillaceae bacterium]MBT3931906.1 hypothetical protein [Rhodospirillaceae bacterium]MBT4772500.1 hypothetical protein [Rhodospirillaceae bacterium]MBT5358089.1 hypothetical protein [Rhodospirillaceae bacterium]
MTQLGLDSSLIDKLFSKTTLLWAAVAFAFVLVVGTASPAHAHADPVKPSEYTTQVVAETLTPGHPQDGHEEPRTCHHGAVPCSSGHSMSNADLAGVLRSTTTVPFSVITGFPPVSFLTIDPPPPKQRTAELN